MAQRARRSIQSQMYSAPGRIGAEWPSESHPSSALSEHSWSDLYPEPDMPGFGAASGLKPIPCAAAERNDVSARRGTENGRP